MKTFRLPFTGRAVWPAALLLLALASLLRPAAVHAAAITVAAGEVAVLENDLCSLREAIINANANAATHDDCTAGSGADVITLPAGSLFTLTDSYADYSGPTGLPQVTGATTIEGHGATIDRESLMEFRHLAVANPGNLTLNDLTLTDGLLSANSGGSISVVTSPLTLNNSTLSGNTATIGGAIYSNGTLTLNNSRVSGNTASSSSGGGMYLLGITVTINNSTVSDNTATSSSGGGLYLNRSPATLNGSTVSGNSAGSPGDSSSGGGIFSSETLTLNNSTVSGNTATFRGGGIFSSETLTLNNSTLSGNRVTSPTSGGGGIFSFSGTVNLNRSLISGNASNTHFEVIVRETINADNHNVLGRSGISNAQAFSFTPGANDFNATNDGTPTALGSILNTTLADNGGPTMTHALVVGSPAIDRAPSADCTAAPINGIDQRGAPRNVDGNAAAGADECDAGAFEYLSSPPTGTIVITKAATPEDDTPFSFSHTLDVAGTFTLMDPSDNSITFSDVPTGSYDVIEDGETGWTLDDIDCDDPTADTVEDEATNTATIALSADETVTCTFENSRDTGTVIIEKAATPEDDTPFDFTHTLNITGTFTLMDSSDNTETFNDVPTGSYTVTETGETGWTLDDITCVDPDSGSSDAGNTATIELDAGETVTCTFSNSRDTGTVIIQKAATPEDDTPFDFTHTLNITGTFTLMDSSDNTETFNDVPTGSYTVTETGETGWTLDDITCVDPDNGSSDAGNTATIELDAGETVTCTFSNSRDTGTIVIVKAATPANNTPFSFTENIPGVGSGFTLSDPSDNTETFSNVPTGSYSVAETVPAPWLLDDIDCNDTNSVENEATATATINLEKDETVTCTFSNSKIPGAEPEFYVSTSAGGVTADNVTFGPHDILHWNGSAWSKWFDGADAGLKPNGKAAHNINAVWIPDTAGDEVYVSFAQNARFVIGVAGKVDGMDVVWWDGDSFALWFDGQDVGLTNKSQEKIDALHVLDGGLSPVGSGCLHYLLISTQGPGQVPAAGGPPIKFGGEDVLGFCMTHSGAATAGVWHKLVDGSNEGMPRNSLASLSASDDGQTLYLTTKGKFNVDGASGGHSMVYAFAMPGGPFSGPIFSALANGLPKFVDALQVE